jgi:hypothetical protein
MKIIPTTAAAFVALLLLAVAVVAQDILQIHTFKDRECTTEVANTQMKQNQCLDVPEQPPFSLRFLSCAPDASSYLIAFCSGTGCSADCQTHSTPTNVCIPISVGLFESYNCTHSSERY